MGALAESFGLRQGLKYRRQIKEELETVRRLDPRFQDGSADRALGRWYFKVPSLFGGSHKEAEAHLRAPSCSGCSMRRLVPTGRLRIGSSKTRRGRCWQI
jgi:hypothetical protein